MLTKKDNSKNELKTNKAQKSQNEEYENYQNSLTATKSKPPATATRYDSNNLSDRRSGRTKVTIKKDVGFNNQLSIRGKGANLNWERGQPLKNVKSDEWIWETDANFSQCEFKVLINDRQYETGENHQLMQGASVVYTPQF